MKRLRYLSGFFLEVAPVCVDTQTNRQTDKQTDRQTHKHGDSMTNLASWGRVGENVVLLVLPIEEISL